MKIEIDTDSKKIFILESINLKDFWEDLDGLGIADDQHYTIEVKPPIIVVPYQITKYDPNPIITLPWLTPGTPINPYEVYCTSNTAEQATN